MFSYIHRLISRRAGLILFGMLFCSPDLQADNQEPLRAGVVDVAPFGQQLPDGGVSGIYADLLQAIANANDINLTLHLYPFPRINRMLADGELDLTLLFNNKVLQEKADQLVSVAEIDTLLVSMRERNVEAAFHAKKPLAIGRLSGGCAALAPSPQFTFYELNNYGSGLKMLQRKRIDALCSVDFAIQEKLHELQFAPNVLGWHVVGKSTVWLQVRRGLAQSYRERLRVAVETLKSKGSVQTLLNRYRRPTIIDPSGKD